MLYSDAVKKAAAPPRRKRENEKEKKVILENVVVDEMPNPFDDACRENPRTLLELDMIALSASLRAKRNWRAKIYDATIVAKWRQEAIRQQQSVEPTFHDGLQDASYHYDDSSLPIWGEEVIQQRRFWGGAMFDLVMQQLRYFDTTLSRDDIRPAPVDRVFESDDRIDSTLRRRLVDAVRQLEDNSETDWHPGSGEQVRDLVHPSLFSVVSGVTRRVSDARNWKEHIGSGKTITLPKVPNDEFSSSSFQWLPTDVIIGAEGQLHFDGYINNLYPDDNQELYTTLERILERFLPMFSCTLTRRHWPLQVDPPQLQADYGFGSNHEELDDPLELENLEAGERENATIILNVPESPPPPRPMPTLPHTYRPPTALGRRRLHLDRPKRRLQVIVKLANIELTPSKPEYEGGVWHVEGMRNEAIVATGIYYYASDNISESCLQFRVAVQDEDQQDFPHDGHGAVWATYGFSPDSALNQQLGSVITEEGRCICFPNSMQHRVAPFRLEDATRRGHRKILVFFLVDPRKTIVSTSSVPPQQWQWYVRELIGTLPLEVWERVGRHVDFPISLERAKEYRRKLMSERKYCINQQNEQQFARRFSLCEH